MTAIPAKSIPPVSPVRPKAIWSNLTQPHDQITDLAERRRARLLTSFLLALILLSLLGTTLSSFPSIINGDMNAVRNNVVNLAFPLLLLVGVYALSRSRYFHQAAYLSLAVLYLGTMMWVMSSQADSSYILNYFLIYVLIAAMVFSGREVAGTIVVSLLLIMVFPLLAPDHPSAHSTVLRGAFFFVAIASVIVLIFMQHRNAIEKDRRTELTEALNLAQQANASLTESNAALERARLAAEESARLKSEFLSTMSHELRTPLNAIRGFCGIMLEGMGGEIDDEARHMLNRVHSNGDRLLGLINDILDISKIEAGRMELVNEPFAPRALVEKWRSQISVLAEKKALNFEVDIDPALPEQLYGDAERITQIAVNLMSNAIKFTENGGVRLAVQVQDNQWLIRVTDSGIGIPPHALNYIFEEFRQVDGSSTRVYGGTGLGLAIVKKLCRMMGGDIKVTSELGKGSVFTVNLPVQVDKTGGK